MIVLIAPGYLVKDRVNNIILVSHCIFFCLTGCEIRYLMKCI